MGVTLSEFGYIALGPQQLAARAIAMVDATREQLGVRVYAIVQRIFRAQFVSAVEAVLGPQQFEAAKAAGTDDDPDKAIEELLRITA